MRPTNQTRSAILLCAYHLIRRTGLQQEKLIMFGQGAHVVHRRTSLGRCVAAEEGIFPSLRLLELLRHIFFHLKVTRTESMVELRMDAFKKSMEFFYIAWRSMDVHATKTIRGKETERTHNHNPCVLSPKHASRHVLAECTTLY
jgi:hypothetical protein